jgi:hypothetical protein
MDMAKLAKTAILPLALVTLTPNNITARPPQTKPQMFRFAQPAANAAGSCEIYYALQPVDPALLKLLGTPAVPTNSNLLTSPEYIQQRDWDFPSKVTPWSQRPKAEEIAQRREALADTAESSKPKGAAIPNWALWNYGLEPFTAHDWTDLQKWFAKELPKKVSGACVEPQKADHLIVVGVIVLGSGGPVDSTGARIQYGQTVGQLDTTVGPNSGISPAVGTHRASQELSADSNSSRPGAHACSYLFRSAAPGGARNEAPEDYYCRSSGDEPRAAISALFRYLAVPGKN